MTLPEKIVDVAFLLPVIGSTIWLGQRNTEPKKGMYGAIGGKTDQQQGLVSPFEVRQWKRHLGGAILPKVADRYAEAQGLEYIGGTACREFCEEAFSAQVDYPGKAQKFDPGRLVYPRDFNPGDITDILDLGFFYDYNDQKPGVRFDCHVYLGRVHRTDFRLSPRELSDIKPLHEIDPKLIWPGTQMALEHIRRVWAPDGMMGSVAEGLGPNVPEDDISQSERCAFTYHYLRIVEQIKPQNITEYRFTNMFGALQYFLETGLE